MLTNAWWLIFFLALAGNVYGWAFTLLRVLQNLDGAFAKLCLVGQFVVPVGFVMAFIFGWLQGSADKHRRVMWVWSASMVLFAIWCLWQPVG